MEVLGLFYFPTWLVYVLCVASLYYLYCSWHFNEFKKRGIAYERPLPIFGNLRDFMKVGAIKTQIRFYEKFKDKGIYGFFEGRVPIYVVCKPEYIREVLVGQFHNFVNRRVFKGVSDRKPLDLTLTTLKDDHWKYVRNTITPTFSAKKLKGMVSLINEAADSLVASLHEKAKTGDPIEVKAHCGSYTMDVISSTAFGIKVDSQKDPNNPLIKSAKQFFDPHKMVFFFYIIFFLPFLLKLLTLRKSSVKKISAAFIDSTEENIKYRQENPANYSDLLQMMLDTRKEKKTEKQEAEKQETEKQEAESSDTKKSENAKVSTWTRTTGLTDDEILSQAVLFFVAGYETTANTLAFVMYNLALNKDCLEKVLEEVDRVLGDSKPDYDSVTSLTYLDMCISETLRLYPPGHRLDRIASNDVIIGGCEIPKDALVIIPAASIHKDEQYWDDPEKFDPKRFTTENKAKRQPFTYLPFGDGPRNCVGMRLALLETKIALARLLQAFKPVKCEKTQVPIDLPKMGNFTPPEGVWLKLEPRECVHATE